jgi:RHS repeat-associated protein
MPKLGQLVPVVRFFDRAAIQAIVFITRDQITAGLVDFDQPIPGAESAERRFVWGLRYIDDCVLREFSLGNRRWALQDANWNVVALGNDSSAAQERFAYDPYGASIELESNYTPGSSNWEVRFTGQRWDIASQLYNYRMREYHPLLGRLLTRDPSGQELASVHTNLAPRAEDVSNYEYVESNPLNAVDPAGMQSRRTEEAAAREEAKSAELRFDPPVRTPFPCGEPGTKPSSVVISDLLQSDGTLPVTWRFAEECVLPPNTPCDEYLEVPGPFGVRSCTRTLTYSIPKRSWVSRQCLPSSGGYYWHFTSVLPALGKHIAISEKIECGRCRRASRTELA